MATKWIWVTEAEFVTKKNPDGAGRWVRADRIDSVCPYPDGCTIGIGGSYLHITKSAEDIMDEIDMRGSDAPKPSTGPR
jgi:hypothetical protein